MSEAFVYAVFSWIPETSVGKLDSLSVSLDGAVAFGDDRKHRGYAFNVQKIASDEAREKSMVPGAFVADWEELPGVVVWMHNPDDDMEPDEGGEV